MTGPPVVDVLAEERIEEALAKGTSTNFPAPVDRSPPTPRSGLKARRGQAAIGAQL
jgi:hypothetical protein